MMRNQLDHRRPPSLYALVVVVLATIAGVGLFVWGPVNPNVDVNVRRDASPGIADWASKLIGMGESWGAGQSVGPDGRARTDLVVTNHSFASVDVVSARAVPVGHGESSPPAVTEARGMPERVGHGESTEVSVTVDARAVCVAAHGGTVHYRILVDVRSASGIVRTIGNHSRVSLTCDAAALPAAGPGPADPSASRTAIAAAFDVAYDFTAPPGRRQDAVDDPGGLVGPVGEITTGSYAGIAATVEVDIVEIVFTSPTKASVLYDLIGVPGTFGTGRIGEARLIDGHWKVTRATVCADLALAQVSCPED